MDRKSASMSYQQFQFSSTEPEFTLGALRWNGTFSDMFYRCLGLGDEFDTDSEYSEDMANDETLASHCALSAIEDGTTLGNNYCQPGEAISIPARFLPGFNTLASKLEDMVMVDRQCPSYRTERVFYATNNTHRTPLTPPSSHGFSCPMNMNLKFPDQSIQDFAEALYAPEDFLSPGPPITCSKFVPLFDRMAINHDGISPAYVGPRCDCLEYMTANFPAQCIDAPNTRAIGGGIVQLVHAVTGYLSDFDNFNTQRQTPPLNYDTITKLWSTIDSVTAQLDTLSASRTPVKQPVYAYAYQQADDNEAEEQEEITALQDWLAKGHSWCEVQYTLLTEHDLPLAEKLLWQAFDKRLALDEHAQLSAEWHADIVRKARDISDGVGAGVGGNASVGATEMLLQREYCSTDTERMGMGMEGSGSGLSARDGSRLEGLERLGADVEQQQQQQQRRQQRQQEEQELLLLEEEEACAYMYEEGVRGCGIGRGGNEEEDALFVVGDDDDEEEEEEEIDWEREYEGALRRLQLTVQGF